MLAMSHSPEYRHEFERLLAKSKDSEQVTTIPGQVWSAVLQRIRGQHEFFPKSYATLRDRGHARVPIPKAKARAGTVVGFRLGSWHERSIFVGHAW
jgi:hypothetical protein